eukprot:264810_1
MLLGRWRVRRERPLAQARRRGAPEGERVRGVGGRRGRVEADAKISAVGGGDVGVIAGPSGRPPPNAGPHNKGHAAEDRGALGVKGFAERLAWKDLLSAAAALVQARAKVAHPEHGTCGADGAG